MKIRERDLYDENGLLNISKMNFRKSDNVYLYIKPLNAWVRLTTLVNEYLKKSEVE